MVGTSGVIANAKSTSGLIGAATGPRLPVFDKRTQGTGTPSLRKYRPATDPSGWTVSRNWPGARSI